jgi:DNA-binding CsgD family transcriptional regulator
MPAPQTLALRMSSASLRGSPCIQVYQTAPSSRLAGGRERFAYSATPTSADLAQPLAAGSLPVRLPHRAIDRDACQRAEVDRLRVLRGRIDTLTLRQLGVLRHVHEARLQQADRCRYLGIAERKVKLYRTPITSKLKVRAVAKLSKLVEAAGLFEARTANLP